MPRGCLEAVRRSYCGEVASGAWPDQKPPLKAAVRSCDTVCGGGFVGEGCNLRRLARLAPGIDSLIVRLKRMVAFIGEESLRRR
jgi:hypothetical protein